MRLRIGTLAILGVAVVTALVIGVMAGLIVRAHRGALVAQLTRSADQLSETIASTTYHDMLENRRDAVRREIATVGRQRGIEKVRLFNAAGEITYSSDAAEIGHALDKNAEACYACHAAGSPLQKLSMKQRARIYRSPDGHRVLGMIRPIHNEQGCWASACHAHSQADAVLGVLDVDLSLADADAMIARDQRRLMLLAALAIAASSLLLWGLSNRLILRPVAQLIAGTRQVAQGDLLTTIPATAQHELGDVARAFNEMTKRLADAQRQLHQADKLASVGRLAAGVAHEINNPLTGVLSYASFLEKRLGDQPEVKADLEVIVRETKRCREIVRGLLDFARQTPPQRLPTDLNEVVRRGVAIVMNPLTLARVSLAFDLAPDLEPLPADANQLQQVVVNLLLNASDALGGEGGNGGTIHIHTRRSEVPPRGNLAIRAAACPKGCNLLDTNVRIGGFPAIRAVRRVGAREVLVHLDPVYGRQRHRAPETCEAGAVATYTCPSCHSALGVPEQRCGACGAPVFAVQVEGSGAVEWCTRKGCAWTRWEAADARGAAPYAELAIEDTGKGIAPDDLDHLFEPFFSTKGARGSGLGLAVTWGIVEGHGGLIDVDSAPGQGTTFTVRLPYLQPAAAEPMPAPVRMPEAAHATHPASAAIAPAPLANSFEDAKLLNLVRRAIAPPSAEERT